MRVRRIQATRDWYYLAMIFMLAAGSAGCSSATGAKNDPPQTAGTSTDSQAGHIDVMCVGDRIDAPSETFHYSYKYADATVWMNDEADITPQAMDVTTKDKSGTHSYHGVRSNDESWGSTFLTITHLSMTVMAARLDSLNGTSSIVSKGAESTNGYTATKYSIDTTGANSSDKESFQTLFGKGSFDKGAIWMGQDSCVVKLVLDEGVYQTDGTIGKRHFEMARIKK